MFITNTLPSIPDQRDIPFVPSVQKKDFKSFIDLIPDIHVVQNQGNIGSCVANGVVAQCEWIKNTINNNRSDLSRLFLYTATLDYENRLGEEGLYTRDAYKVAYKYGICDESIYPYNTALSMVRPPEAVYAQAYNTRVRRYEAVVAPGTTSTWYEAQDKIDRIIAALNEGLPVGIACSVSSELYSLTGPWQTHTYSGFSSNTDIGGHYMVLHGYDLGITKFLGENSWGPDWGDGGFGGLDFNIVMSPFFEAWIIREFDTAKLPESPGIKFEGINRYKIDARIVPDVSDYNTTVNIWIGAKSTSGVLFLRDELDNSQINPSSISFDGSKDKWSPYDGTNTPATFRNVNISNQDIPIQVVQWMNLSGLGGSTVYVAYGNSPMDWKLTELCVIPDYR